MTQQAETARALLRAGISVIPIGKNKVPAIPWKEFCNRLPTEEEVSSWFSTPQGIGRVCGAISGNLEVIDFDVDSEALDCPSSSELLTRWGEIIEGRQPGLLDRLTTIQTPRPGFHVTYRCFENVGGNQKLATFSKRGGGWKTVIETRGEGGYALCPGSPAHCHPLGGDLYRQAFGPPLTELQVITAKERENLLQAARSFCRKPPEPEVQERVSRTAPGTSPGEIFAARATWAEILEPHGLSLVSTDGSGVSYWRRAGSSNKWSASTGFGDSGLFYAFSPNCGVEPNRGYNKFSMFTHLNHSGDFEAAARDLAEKGFREELPSIDISSIVQRFEERKTRIQEPEAEFPQELFSCPGIIRGLIDYNLSTAFVPQPVLALSGAIAFMGALIGRKVTDWQGSRANVYIINLAGSGRGKEHARKVNKFAASEALAEDLIGEEMFASGAGLLRTVSENPSQLFQLDEVGRMLRELNNPRAGSHQSEIVSNLMKLFTSSGSMFMGSAYAEKSNKAPLVIDSPNCNVLGTTVPDSFFQALSVEGLTDGFLSRLMVFVGSEEAQPQRVDSSTVLDPQVVAMVKSWHQWSPDQAGGVWANAKEIPSTPEARALMWDFTLQAHNSGSNEVERALWSRASEKAHKLALIHACSESPITPEIGSDAAEWAIRLSSYLTSWIVRAASEKVFETVSERDSKRVEEILKSKALITSTEFYRKTRWLQTRERKAILSELIERDLVQAGSEGSGGRPRVVYSWIGD
ncbi:hypothetical protein KOR42_32920 [Thalassoglobus neptunius]|uniref:DNA primase/polymerase bifunctional N-terminal domain-containing protein n=1 Tax=Thalassoglobus neptunius TaxID=1938619 RepID=A0A5C5WNX1_9PLAN|nr:bifunctional DNA primase/polymerase [Thalassoglobus neptunius]TWT51819.1 hypothetical protein KOR42_32920 [Thalassoglobus neptunius]